MRANQSNFCPPSRLREGPEVGLSRLAHCLGQTRPPLTPPASGRGTLWCALILPLLTLTTPALAKKPPQGFAPALPAPPPPTPRVADGAIFSVSTGYAPLVSGNRAHGVGDPLVIALVENTTTAKSANSKTGRSGGFSITPPTAGPLAFLNPDALKASGQGSFKGDGSAGQTSSLSGTVAVTIAEVRPNGTALIRGEKRMLLSQGQEWIQFSGIVRLADIDADNVVRSAQVADARLEYSGNGSIQRAGREGWLSRFFNIVSPF